MVRQKYLAFVLVDSWCWIPQASGTFHPMSAETENDASTSPHKLQGGERSWRVDKNLSSDIHWVSGGQHAAMKGGRWPQRNEAHDISTPPHPLLFSFTLLAQVVTLRLVKSIPLTQDSGKETVSFFSAWLYHSQGMWAYSTMELTVQAKCGNSGVCQREHATEAGSYRRKTAA